MKGSSLEEIERKKDWHDKDCFPLPSLLSQNPPFLILWCSSAKSMCKEDCELQERTVWAEGAHRIVCIYYSELKASVLGKVPSLKD